MKNREIKKALKSAYVFNESKAEKSFIKIYDKKSMQFFDVLKMELQFMGLKSAISGAILLSGLGLLSAMADKNGMWLISSLLPLFSLILALIMGKSERYKMDELENSCRFSLSFVRMVRMLIIGGVSIILILAFTMIFQNSQEGRILTTLCFIGCPYLLSVFGCILATRKIHRGESVFACGGVTGLCCLLPMLFKVKIYPFMGTMKNTWAGIFFMAVGILTVTESLIYIKEGNQKKWNWC